MYVEHTEEYKGYTIEIIREEGASKPDWSFLGRFLFFGGRNYIDLIDDAAYIDFDHSFSCYQELGCYVGYEDESYSLAAELTRKRYEFREVWRDGYGNWLWGQPNVLSKEENSVEGIIYVTPEQIREEYGHKIATAKDRATVQRVLEGELDVWKHWAEGDVYGWTASGEGLDESCWGYYEDYETWKGEPLYPILAAREVIDWHIKQREEEDEATLTEYVLSIA